MMDKMRKLVMASNKAAAWELLESEFAQILEPVQEEE
jgi:hypothetical protein